MLHIWLNRFKFQDTSRIVKKYIGRSAHRVDEKVQILEKILMLFYLNLFLSAVIISFELTVLCFVPVL